MKKISKISISCPIFPEQAFVAPNIFSLKQPRKMQTLIVTDRSYFDSSEDTTTPAEIITTTPVEGLETQSYF